MSGESWETKNNCKECKYKTCKPEDDDGFCYMFRNAPKELCMKHSELKNSEQPLMALMTRIFLHG